MKVYCDDCNNLRYKHADDIYNCGSKDNVIDLGEDTWACRMHKIEYKNKPQELNKNNDCEWFNVRHLLKNKYKTKGFFRRLINDLRS